MKNASILLPSAVFVAVGIGFCRARRAEDARPLPSFSPSAGAQLPELVAPGGDQTLSGRVVDIDSNPLAGVTVFLRSGGVPLWTETDASGAFELRGLVAGPHDVALVKWGHPPRMAHVDGPSTEVELTLMPPKPPPPPLPTIASGALTGRIAHPIGGLYADPEGYELQLEPRADITEFQAAVLRRVNSDGRGFFAVEDLAFGDYAVRVVPSWAAGGSWPDLVSLADAQCVHAADGGDFAVFGLDVGAIEATVLDTGGTAIEGAFAILSDARDPSHVWPPQQSDGYGVLRFLDLPPGGYRISLRAGESAIEEVLVEVAGAEIAKPSLPPLAIRKR